jgi:hypothetical protein
MNEQDNRNNEAYEEEFPAEMEVVAEEMSRGFQRGLKEG